MESKMVGAVAECGGIRGVIYSLEIDVTNKTAICCTGVTLTGKQWKCNNPEIIANNVNEYVKKILNGEIKERSVLEINQEEAL